MRNTLSFWLTGIIVLTILAFLAVFKPITFSARKDPSDASHYLRPVSVKEFNATVEPEGTFSFFNSPVYVYVPQHDLRLGLDLRGGMRVVLTIPERITFHYPLVKSLSDADLIAKQKALNDILSADPAFGEDQDVEVTFSTTDVTVVTSPGSVEQREAQFAALNTAMTNMFGEGNFTIPDKTDIFDDTKMAEERKELQTSVGAIMEKRMNSSGLTEVTAYAAGRDRIVLEIPGVKDPDLVRKNIRSTAQMEFRLIPSTIQVSVSDGGRISAWHANGGAITGTDQEITAQVLKESMLVLSGKDMKPNFRLSFNDGGKPAISFEVKDDKKNDFAAFTAGHIHQVMAIVLDGKIQMAPQIQNRIPGSGIITGNFTQEGAKEWAKLLNAGALPVSVKIAETRTVSATLGADSVAASLIAGLVGLVLVLIFMASYYRLPGLIANLALLIYIVLSLAVLKLFDATLTLPGIAGIIISIGMAVDANILIFERLKEELRTQKPLETAIDVAFSRAWTAILDSNVASMITGFVLYALGTGAVKGFAITLLIGVAVSMFTAVTITRLFMKLMIRSKAGHNLAWYGI